MTILWAANLPRKGENVSLLDDHPSSAELGIPSKNSENESSDDGAPEAYSDRGDNNVPLLPATEHFPEVDPRSAVEAWKIAAIGRRPQDYLARDLLLNSLWRDERPRLFHDLVKKPPAWIDDHVRHLPGDQDNRGEKMPPPELRQLGANLGASWAAEVSL